MYEEKIKSLNENEEDDINLLLFYFSNALDFFIYGNYDLAFLECFKIVFDFSGFVKLYKIDEFEEKRPNYRKIRTAIAHPKKEKEFESVDELVAIHSKLYDEAISILKIARFDFLDKLTERELDSTNRFSNKVSS